MTDHAILQLFINRIEKAIEEIDKNIIICVLVQPFICCVSMKTLRNV